MKELVTKLTHGTRDEVRYLRHIGEEAGSKLPRSQLLANYIAAALLRTKWGNLDKETLLAEAGKLQIDAVLEEKVNLIKK
jgi:hypothetical protein